MIERVSTPLIIAGGRLCARLRSGKSVSGLKALLPSWNPINPTGSLMSPCCASLPDPLGLCLKNPNPLPLESGITVGLWPVACPGFLTAGEFAVGARSLTYTFLFKINTIFV